MRRRTVLQGAIAGTFLTLARGAGAVVPECAVLGKRLRWISPYPVAGEVVSRALVPFVEQYLGTEIIVEMAAGAGGMRGSKMIHDARPDGLTLGIIFGALDLFRNELAGSNVPHPVTDYTVFGRIHGNRHVWAVGADSRFETIEDLIEYGETNPILAASNTPGGSDFASVTVASDLLGVNSAWLTGFRGTEYALAVSRGEADLVCVNAATLVPMFAAGDLRPVLQVGAERVSPAPVFDDVPLLGGPDGLAAHRARDLERDVDAAVKRVDDLAGVIKAGRLVVGPPGIPDDPRECIARAVYAALRDPGFQEKANTIGLILNVADAETALADMQTAAERMQQFMPMLRDALKATGHTGRG